MSAIKLWMTLCLFVVSSIPVSAAVTRQPYLQKVSPSSVTIVWQTDLASTNDSRVQYGTVSGALNQTAFGTGGISLSNGGVKNHVVTIAGLLPATTYFYNVGTVTNGVQGGGTANHFMVTAPSTGIATPFTAWIVGDSGDGSSDQIAVRDAMLGATGSTPLDLFLHVGDMAYEDGTDLEFTDNYFAVYQDILRQTPVWPTIGNHESFSFTSAGIGPYYEAHVLPMSGEAGGVSSGTESYYSFDYANAHFIVLDSMTSSRNPGSAMLTWLQDDLSGTTQEWVIALFHHPPYTKGSHDSDSAADSGGRLVDMRENVLPLLDAGGVDLVLGGHSHIYERSFPLLGAYGFGSSPNFATPDKTTLLSNGNILDAGNGQLSGNGAYQLGTVYVVAGHGGKSVSTANGGNHPVMFQSTADFGSVLLDVNGSNLTVRNVEPSGASWTITDSFSINKTELGEIVWRQSTTGEVGLWLLNGLSAPIAGVIATVPDPSWGIKQVGDVSGDGREDLIWRHATTGEVGVWLGNGLTLGSTGVIASVPDPAWSIQGGGDLSGDGKADLVWRHATTGEVGVWLGNGLALGSTGVIASVPDPAWTIQGVGDLSGDGKADLVWRHATTGEVGVWLGNGLALGTTGVIATVPDLGWGIKGVGDVNDDGMDDLVWRHATTGEVSVWLGNGLALGTTGVIATVPDLGWSIKAVGDVNGDGKADLVWRHTITGDVDMWLLNGLNTFTMGTIVNSLDLGWKIQ